MLLEGCVGVEMMIFMLLSRIIATFGVLTSFGLHINFITAVQPLQFGSA